jgi:hypothetical protein
LKPLRACCGVWLRRWSPRLGRELAEARRVGARAEELSAIRDILYEDKWFRIATAVYVQLKKLFAEDGKAGELLEAAERRLYGLRLEVVEVASAEDRGGRGPRDVYVKRTAPMDKRQFRKYTETCRRL